MAALDHATLQAVLDKQGMPNTTENLNRIAQFAAVAPDMLDKYLGRGTDQARVDNNVGSAIDKSIAATDGGASDPRLAALAGPNPYKATIDPNTGLSNIGPGLVNTPEPRAGGGARVAPKGRGGAAGATEPDVPPQGAPPPAAGDGDSNWWLKLLPALLGTGYRGNRGAPGEPWAPQPGSPEAEQLRIGQEKQLQLEGPQNRARLPAPTEQLRLPAPQQRLPAPEAGAPQAPPPQQALPAPDRTNRPPPTQQQLDEVAQENAAQQAASEAQQRRLKDEMRLRAQQENTRTLLRSGKNVFRK